MMRSPRITPKDLAMSNFNSPGKGKTGKYTPLDFDKFLHTNKT